MDDDRDSGGGGPRDERPFFESRTIDVSAHDGTTGLPAGGPAPPQTDAGAERYRVEGSLGQGGMAVVDLAIDTRLDRLVAVKRLRKELEGIRRRRSGHGWGPCWELRPTWRRSRPSPKSNPPKKSAGDKPRPDNEIRWVGVYPPPISFS